MKLLICCAVLAVATLGQCLTSSEELMSARVNMLKNYVRERQSINELTGAVEKICPGFSTKFETSLAKVQQCVNDIDEDSETMCSTVKNHFEKCTSPVVKVFEECLPETSQDIPAFLVKSVLSVSDVLCTSDGEHIFELSNPCVRSQNYRTQRCARKIHTKMQQFKSKLPSKQEICDFMTSFQGCFMSHLQASCGHPKTREAFLNMYSAAMVPCRTAESENEIEDVDTKHEWVAEV